MRFISIDPGTHWCGVAIWNDERPIKTWLISGGRSVLVSDRIKLMLDGLNGLMRTEGKGVTEVAIEQAQGFEDDLPAPQLQALIEDIRQWAKKQRVEPYTYRPQTVVAMVRPRGMPSSNKQAIRMGIRMLAEEYNWPEIAGLTTEREGIKEQNIIDALAVGWCHIRKQKEAAMLREAQQQLWPDESVARKT